MNTEFNRNTSQENMPAQKSKRFLAPDGVSQKPILVEILLIVVVGILAFTTLNPYTMPMGIYLTVLLALLVLFAFFATFVWREKGGDERERTLLHMSDRAAFLAGATVLIIAVLVDGVLFHMSSPWVLAALSAMIITKAASYIYNQNKH